MSTQNYPSGSQTDNGFRGLPKPQKISVSILASLAVLIVFFWVWQMRAQIEKPFVYEAAEQPAGSEQASDLDLLLQDSDRDSDGISDYDEIYIYKTSPYLEDSDSDGLNDEAEISAGKNPNCPEGKNCLGDVIQIEEDAVIITPNQEPVVLPSATGDFQSMDGAQLQEALSGDLNGATLRQLLISSGTATAESLSDITDEELLSSYQEALKNQSQ